MGNMSFLERVETTVLPLNIAMHQAVKRCKGGVGAVAGAYGRRASTLQNKLNPTQDSHTLNIEEFEEILEYTRSSLILDSIGRIAGVAWVDLHQFHHAGDMAMLETITRLVERVGQLSGNVHMSLADNRVDPDEMAMLEKDVLRLVGAAHAVLERAKQYMD